METVDLHAEAWAGVRNGIESGRLAHAYVIVGSPRGDALHFTESFLKLLFCENIDKPCNACAACRQIDTHRHIDTLWIEPQSKTRQIKAEDIRILIQRLVQTSFEGGWKAGIILAADCMNQAAANILLKTLEEPPAKTILLLVTDSPQSLLPTIISRCQKIVLSESKAGALDAVWQEPLMQILRALPPASGLEASRLAGQLKELFDEVKKGIADTVNESFERTDEALDESKLKVVLEARTSSLLKEVQANVLRVMLDWQRDVLMLVSGVDEEYLRFSEETSRLAEQAARHTQVSALNATREVEAMARRIERNIPDLQVFDEAFRRLVR